MSNLICLAMIVATVLLCLHLDGVKVQERLASCRVYGGKPHTEEKPFAEMKDGCKVSEVKAYDEVCLYNGTVYVTNCSAVSWDRHIGKSVKRMSNVRNDK